MKTSVKAALGAATAFSLLLAGCSGSEADNSASSETNSSSSDTQRSEKSTGTVTVKHAWGEDEYPVNPEKIVAIGGGTDDLLALDVTPDVVIATSREKDAPWRADNLDNSHIIEVTTFRDVPIEEIANAEPDIIVGDFWTINQDSYSALKEIAPTIGGIGAASTERGWRPRIEALGKIFDKEETAQKVLNDHDELFAETAKNLPGLKGKSGLVAQFAKERGGIGVVIDPEEPGNSFLKELGMTLPEGLSELEDNGSGRAMVPAETISVMNGDFGVIYAVSGTEEDIHAIPGFDDLRQVKEDTMVFGDAILVQALNNPSSLSLSWALEQLRPTLEKVSKL